MTTFNIFLAFFAPFLATLLFVPAVRVIALKKGWVDAPDGQRKLHAKPTPNIGGIAMAAGVGIGFFALILIGAFEGFGISTRTALIFSGAFIIVCAGFYDDLYGLGFKKKFVVQMVVAYLLLHAGYHIEVANLPFMSEDPYHQTLYTFPLTVLWIVGILNAVNLLDGLDGLAAGVSLIAFACLAMIFGIQGDMNNLTIAVLMAGALIAFLVYNFDKASIFMGDSGSFFLGYMLVLCTLSLKGGGHTNPLLALLVPAILLGLPLLDTGLCILRRIIANQSPFAPDHDHIHHRLARLFPRRSAVLILYGIALWFGAAAVLITLVNTLTGLLVVFVTIAAAFLGVRLLWSRNESAKRVAASESSDSEQYKLKDYGSKKVERELLIKGTKSFRMES